MTHKPPLRITHNTSQWGGTATTVMEKSESYKKIKSNQMLNRSILSREQLWILQTTYKSNSVKHTDTRSPHNSQDTKLNINKTQFRQAMPSNWIWIWITTQVPLKRSPCTRELFNSTIYIPEQLKNSEIQCFQIKLMFCLQERPYYLEKEFS